MHLWEDASELVDINTASRKELNRAIVQAAKDVYVFGQAERGINIELDKTGNLVSDAAEGFAGVGKGAEGAGKKVRTFAGMTGKELQAWRDDAQLSLTDISGAFGDLSDDAVITAGELIGAYRKQIEATRDFRQNIKVLIERGARPEFIKSLIDMGAEGALWAEGLAESNEKTTSAFFRTRREAGQSLKGLTGLVKKAADDTDREAGRMSNDFDRVGDSVGNVTGKVRDFATVIGDLVKIPGMAFKLDVDLPQGDGIGINVGLSGGGRAQSWAEAAIAAVPGPQYISSTYRTPAENAAVGGAPNSLHMDASNPAVDISGPKDSSGTFIYGDAIAAYLRQFPVRQLLWRVEDHFDHVHVADFGARVRGPANVRIGNIDEDVLFVPRSGPGAVSPLGGPGGRVELRGRLSITNWKTGVAVLEGVAVETYERLAGRDDDFSRTRQPLYED
jgi:hypothetical protein